jgi:hypothetical protein
LCCFHFSLKLWGYMQAIHVAGIIHNDFLGMFPITVLQSVQYSPTVTVTVSLMHLAITFQYGYSSVHEPSTPVRYGRQRPYMVTVNTYSTCKIYILCKQYTNLTLFQNT